MLIGLCKYCRHGVEGKSVCRGKSKSRDCVHMHRHMYNEMHIYDIYMCTLV